MDETNYRNFHGQGTVPNAAKRPDLAFARQFTLLCHVGVCTLCTSNGKEQCRQHQQTPQPPPSAMPILLQPLSVRASNWSPSLLFNHLHPQPTVSAVNPQHPMPHPAHTASCALCILLIPHPAKPCITASPIPAVQGSSVSVQIGRLGLMQPLPHQDVELPEVRWYHNACKSKHLRLAACHSLRSCRQTNASALQLSHASPLSS